MEAFAAAYCKQNPGIFEEQDTCFILAFSIIMLNTALHNPNAKIKISAEQFVKQNRGINSGRDLPNDMLEAIYRNIKEEPLILLFRRQTEEIGRRSRALRSSAAT